MDSTGPDRAAASAAILFSISAFFACFPLPAGARLASALVDYRSGDTASHPPPRLSLTGLYRDMTASPRAVSDSIYPYEVNAPFWSDGAGKERFITVPSGKTVVPTDSNGYIFPDGSVLIKNFTLDTVEGDTSTRILIETRFLTVWLVDGYPSFSGLSYRWRRDQSDADLVPQSGADALVGVLAGGESRGLRWRYPSQQECSRCHVPESRGAAGFFTQQLNRPIPGHAGGNQLQDLADKGVLAFNPVAGKDGAFRWRAPEDTSAGLEVRARSYLAANCSHCHGNLYNNHADMSFDYFDSAQTNAYSLATGYPGYLGYLDRPKDGDALYPKFIYPGRPHSSFVLWRMLNRGTFEETNRDQMPPLGTYRIDSLGLGLLRDWVCSLGNPATPAAACKLPDVFSEPYAGTGLGGRHGKSGRPQGLKAFLRGRDLTVSSGRASVPAGLRLFDSQGRRIGMMSTGPGTFRMTERLHRGLYFLKAGPELLRLEFLE
ncbi:MAG: yliI [Fibrobacteres bacterium]|nr:yliI [Fibrobacterota bacterium]